MHPLIAPLQCHARGPADVDIIAYPPPKKKNADIRRYPLDCLSALMSVDTRHSLRSYPRQDRWVSIAFRL